MRNLNLSLMAKLGWRLITDLDKLWAKVMHAKYGKGGTWTSKLVNKRAASNAWRGMVASQHILKQGTRTRVYNGLKTLFWRDTWLGDTPLIDLAYTDIPLVDFYKLVQDYWNCMTGWKWEELNGLL